eukprot:3098957-Amphidinium_carterae.1
METSLKEARTWRRPSDASHVVLSVRSQDGISCMTLVKWQALGQTAHPYEHPHPPLNPSRLHLATPLILSCISYTPKTT